jgi:hypothetical protein
MKENSTFKILKSWSFNDKKDHLESSEKDISAHFISTQVGKFDPEKLSLENWKKIIPNFNYKVLHKSAPPAKDGWEQIHQISYDVPLKENLSIMTLIYTYNGIAHIVLAQISNSCLSRRREQFYNIVNTWKPNTMATDGLKKFQCCNLPSEYSNVEVSDECKLSFGKKDLYFYYSEDTLRYNGEGHKFKLPDFEDLDNITSHLCVSSWKNQLIILYGKGTESSMHTAVALNAENLIPSWRTNIWGFGEADIVWGDDLFLSSHGTVSRLNLKSGKVIWVKQNLYDSWGFDGRLEGSSATVRENKVTFKDLNDVTVEVDRESGKILHVEKTYTCLPNIEISTEFRNRPTNYSWTFSGPPSDKVSKKFLKAQIFNDHPDKKYIIEPKLVRTKRSWDLTGVKKEPYKDIWLSCHYEGTDAVLINEISPGIKTCTQKENSNEILCK